ncbi:hypothetical protein V6N12_045432 [Hibiscus sabdariffa]|uniref:Putative plant transposon protein domain-containing protein n=1 Tax=Hibiscus sabdariffa TaxID=183260 RepID=A0ABR2G3G6_9ROSI
MKVFFNNEIKKKYDEVFASRPFIFEKSFDVKGEPHLGFTPEFMLVVAMHKWESFIQQRGDIYLDLLWEFYAHIITKDSPFLMIRGTCVRFEVDHVNNMFNLSCEDDGHENFASSLTATKRSKIVADLRVDGTQWVVAPKGSRSIKRVTLKNQARGWNHFLKATLMSISHNDTISEEHMALLHSIITRRKIIVGRIIVNEAFKCIEMGNTNLLFLLLITNLCFWHKVPKLTSDKALAVKGTLVLPAT